MLRKLYFDRLPSLPSSTQNFGIDSSIATAIRNSSSILMKKVIKNGDERTEMSVSTVKGEEGSKQKCLNIWKDFGYFGTESCDLSIEKANLPKNSVFYVNQGYQSMKDGKKVNYTDVFILAQIMPLAQLPKDIESYEPKEDEVKILRARYDPISGEFFGIENCVAFITVRNDLQEQFFDCRYNKENDKVLYSTKKSKIPNCFKTTIFGQHRMLYGGGAFDREKHSNIYFYLPSSIDRNEKINKSCTFKAFCR